jgi:hypothetical protein
MNEYVLTVLAIIVTIGVGFLLLINFGIDWLIYFGLAVISLSIVGSLFYTWWKTQSDKTVERLKVEILVRLKKDFEDVRDLVSKAGELIRVSSISHDLDLIRNNLINLKFYDSELNVSAGARKYTLTFVEQESRKAGQRLRSLEALAAGEYRPKLEHYIRDLQSKLAKLKGAGYDIDEKLEEVDTISAQPSTSLRQMIEKKERLAEKCEEILDSCIEEVARVATTSRKLGDTKGVERSILEIKKEKADFDSAVFRLVNARNELKEMLREVFSRQHSHLSAHVKSVARLLDEDHINERYKEAIGTIKDSLFSLDDPGRIQEVRELEARFKSQTSAIINDLYSELRDLEESINSHQPHQSVWQPDDKIDSVVEKVDPAEELDAFAKKAILALEHLTKQLRKDVAFIKIIENYNRIEPLIARKLEERGRIEESDLNVKYADKFLLLYGLKNKGAEFQESPPSLVLKSAVASELKQKLKRRRV